MIKNQLHITVCLEKYYAQIIREGEAISSKTSPCVWTQRSYERWRLDLSECRSSYASTFHFNVSLCRVDPAQEASM